LKLRDGGRADEGLRSEVSITELRRKEGINQNVYYRWSKEFLEAGEQRLACDTAREAMFAAAREAAGLWSNHKRAPTSGESKPACAARANANGAPGWASLAG